MRGLLRAALLAIGMILFFSQIASAYSVSSFAVDPTGSLDPDTPVNASVMIFNLPSEAIIAPNDTTIELVTDLDRPVWSATVLTKGNQTALPHKQGKMLLLSEWNASVIFTSPAPIVLQINVSGRAPGVQRTSNQTIIRIFQRGLDGKPVAEADWSLTTVVVNTCCIARIDFHEDELQQFRADIEQNATMRIATGAAEEKFSEAQRNITSAKARPSTQYVQAFSDLDAAKMAIAGGERLLDKAWAEKAVADAQIPINNADNLIAWFTRNASTKDDAQLPAIISKRELAVSNLTAASEDIINGNYEQARSHAQKAFQNANESYSDALSRRQYLAISCWGCGSGDITQYEIPVAGIVAIILLIAGIIWWKKPRQ